MTVTLHVTVILCFIQVFLIPQVLPVRSDLISLPVVLPPLNFHPHPLPIRGDVDPAILVGAQQVVASQRL